MQFKIVYTVLTYCQIFSYLSVLVINSIMILNSKGVQVLHCWTAFMSLLKATCCCWRESCSCISQNRVVILAPTLHQHILLPAVSLAACWANCVTLQWSSKLRSPTSCPIWPGNLHNQSQHPEESIEALQRPMKSHLLRHLQCYSESECQWKRGLKTRFVLFLS